MPKKWIYKLIENKAAFASLQSELNLSDISMQLLLQRNIKTFNEARSFFRPSVHDFHSPYLMKNMTKAVERIVDAIFKGENILIYGDYDVDGTCSVSMMYHFIHTTLGYEQVAFYIPDRYAEGYGISTQGIDFAHQNDVQLIITLDCGIKSIDKIAYANSFGIDTIICDHHLPGEELPEAVAILNPKQKDCAYPYKELCGCGVGFKLIQALGSKYLIDSEIIYSYLDFVAVATAADIVEILGENRSFVALGLQRMNTTPRFSFFKMIENAAKVGRFTVEDIVFFIAPRINAAGRIEHAKEAVYFLLSEDLIELEELLEAINHKNSERKFLDQEIFEEADQKIKVQLEKYPNSIVLHQDDWHKGVIGIVASKIVEKYYKPTIICTTSNGKITGSARSIKNIDIHAAIEKSEYLLENFGGHKAAAGLTLSPENFDLFIEEFDKNIQLASQLENCEDEIIIDAEIDFQQITPTFFSLLKQFQPCGPGNLNPVFTTDAVIVKNVRIVGEHHLQLQLEQNGVVFKAIAFKMAEYASILEMPNPFQFAYTLKENFWNGKSSIQLEVKDFKKIA